MAYRDDGFGSPFGTVGMGVDPRSAWSGPSATRGVLREPSRVHRTHEDERPLHAERGYPGGYPPADYPGYHQGSPLGRRDEHAWYGGEERYPTFTRGQPVPVQHGAYLDHQQEHPEWRDPRGYMSPDHDRRGLVHGTDMGFGEHERGPHYGKGPKGYRRSDERIREEACERIARQGFIDASDVEVHVENAVIRLTGTVATRPEKRGLEHLLDRVHGVEEIVNELRLRREEMPAAPRAQGQTQAQTQPQAQQKPRDNGRSSHS